MSVMFAALATLLFFAMLRLALLRGLYAFNHTPEGAHIRHLLGNGWWMALVMTVFTFLSAMLMPLSFLVKPKRIPLLWATDERIIEALKETISKQQAAKGGAK